MRQGENELNKLLTGNKKSTDSTKTDSSSEGVKIFIKRFVQEEKR